MQIKTASQLLNLNNTKLPLQFSGFPRSGSTAAERNAYRQIVINNPIDFPGYVGEVLRTVGWIDYEYKSVPVAKDVDVDKVIDQLNSQGNTIDHSNDHLGMEISEKDINNINNRLSIFERYGYNQLFMKLFNHDFLSLGAVNQQTAIDILENNFWVFTYRKNYIDQIISFCYAFKTGDFHYYDHYPFKPKQVLIEKDLVKKLMLLSYSNAGLIWSGRTNVAYVEKEQLSGMEDNTDKYLNIAYNNLLPPNLIISQPHNISKDMQSLVVNYDECVKMARRVMKIVCKNSQGFIEVSGDEIQLNG